MQKHQTTIIDIARELGISKSTVSRALKDHPDIKTETKEKIRNLAMESGYRPNMLALSFKQNRTNIIGILVPDIERPFYASVISGVQQRANNQNFFVVIFQSKDSYVAELNIIQTMLELRVCGILICHSKETVEFPHISELIKKGVPLLLLDRANEEHEAHKVSTDHFVGGYMIGEHLALQGYKNIAIIGGPPTLQMSNLRVDGCIKALKNAGIPVKKNAIRYCYFQRERVLSAANELLDSKNPPDAFFCVHDRAAIEISKLLEFRNIKVPGDIGLAGFGNEPMSSFIHPSLTTIEQHPTRLGELAAEIIIQEITSETPIKLQNQIISPQLIVRESTVKDNG
ncbi:MAG: LacI family DNA-binding transcriptional regulator [Chitinophagaceae bacterium]